MYWRSSSKGFDNPQTLVSTQPAPWVPLCIQVITINTHFRRLYKAIKTQVMTDFILIRLIFSTQSIWGGGLETMFYIYRTRVTLTQQRTLLIQ